MLYFALPHPRTRAEERFVRLGLLPRRSPFSFRTLSLPDASGLRDRARFLHGNLDPTVVGS